jgi:hypothetical protein
MRIARYFGLAVLTLAVASMGVFRAADNDPKYTIKEVMKMAHTPKEEGSKDPTLYAKVSSGKASKEEMAKLLELYSALPANKPPQGDADAWKTKTTALVDATKAVIDGTDGADKKLKAAAACMECHKVFKPAKK